MIYSYFDAKRELKKLYYSITQAIKVKDAKYINYLASKLDLLEKGLGEDMGAFGLYVLKKEIKTLHHRIHSQIKK